MMAKLEALDEEQYSFNNQPDVHAWLVERNLFI
jgi:uncharacterized protein YdiU (UPF0061 family)